MNESYISSDWLRPLEESFVKGRKKRRLPLIDVGIDLDDMQRLLATYVEPLCRYRDHVGNSGKSSCSAFDAINLFLGEGIDATRRGGNQLWALGDQGIGKSSLLRLLKIAYELEYRSGQFHFEYIALSESSIERISKIENPQTTVLLLDGFDEMKLEAGSARSRCLELLEATEEFCRVFIACDNRTFLQSVCDRSQGDGDGVIGDFECLTMILLEFVDEQIDLYLNLRYPRHWKEALGKAGKRELAQSRIESLGKLGHRPLLLSMIDYLADGEASIRDEYGMLEAASIAWLVKEQEAIAAAPDGAFTIEAFYDLSIRLALVMSERGLKEMGESEAASILGDTVFEMRVADLKGDSLLRRSEGIDGQPAYRFSHGLVASFFAAQGVLETSGPDEIVVPEFASNRMIDFIARGRSSDEEYRQKKLVMRNLKLSDFGFEAADLKGAVIEGADLRNANFAKADLSGVDFLHCKLDGAQFSQANTQGVNLDTPTSGLPVSFEIDEGVFLEMLWVEPGSFNIGNSESPVIIEVKTGFWLGKTPVTQRQFEAIMGSNPSCFRSDSGDLPVERISWSEACRFCEELNQLMPEDLEQPLAFRLPKEAEWTRACRAGGDSTYGHGDNEREFSDYGWYSANSGGQTREVGKKRPNPWGFHDMHGNVWEWCLDRDDQFFQRVISDLKSDEGEAIRAVRGGSWSSLVYACRTANRNWYPPSETASNIGFRVAMVMGEKRSDATD